jgi:hypothetical protein
VSLAILSFTLLVLSFSPPHPPLLQAAANIIAVSLNVNFNAVTVTTEDCGCYDLKHQPALLDTTAPVNYEEYTLRC